MLTRQNIFRSRGGSRDNSRDSGALTKTGPTEPSFVAPKPAAAPMPQVANETARAAPERPAAEVAPPPERPAAVIPASDSAKVTPNAEAKMIVGPNIKMKGVEIADCDTLMVEGAVEATMDARQLEIAPSGSYSGRASVDNAEIHGQFSGELTVRKRLVVHATGKVSGTLRYGKMVVEEGGEISGDIKPGVESEPAKRAATPASAEAKRAEPETSEAKRSGSETSDAKRSGPETRSLLEAAARH